MAVTVVNYRENVGAVYHASGDRRVLHALTQGRQGIISTGDLAVTPQVSGLAITVAAGRCVILAKTATGGSYFVYNDADLDITLAAADGTNPRIDTVVAQVTDTELGDGADNDPADVINVIAGTPGATPTAPATPAASVLLAHVRVEHAATTLTSDKITNPPATYDRTIFGRFGSSSTASISSASWQTVTGFTAAEDPFGFLTASDTFTIPAGLDGVYTMTAAVRGVTPSGPTTFSEVELGLFVNGSVEHLLDMILANQATRGWCVSGGDEFRMSAGDTINVNVRTPHVVGGGDFSVLNPFDGTHRFTIRRVGD